MQFVDGGFDSERHVVWVISNGYGLWSKKPYWMFVFIASFTYDFGSHNSNPSTEFCIQAIDTKNDRQTDTHKHINAIRFELMSILVQCPMYDCINGESELMWTHL